MHWSARTVGGGRHQATSGSSISAQIPFPNPGILFYCIGLHPAVKWARRLDVGLSPVDLVQWVDPDHCQCGCLLGRLK